MENSKEIINYILDITKNMGISNNFSFDDCILLFNKSNKLEQYLDKVIKPPILESDIESIKNELVKTILRIYIDKKNIEIIVSENDEDIIDEYIIYRRYVDKFPVLTREQERELFIAYNNGDEEAKKIICMSNQKFVASIARNYVSDTYSYMTAVQDGNLGLLKAIDDFDVSLGYRFSTYASDIIHQTLYAQKLLEAYSIPINRNVASTLYNYNKLCAQYKEKYDKSLDDETASTLLHISIRKLQALKKMNNSVLSLDQLYNMDDDEDTNLLDFLKDDNNPSVESHIIATDCHNALVEALNHLTEREKFILVERFGLEGGNAKSLEEVGRMLNITRERVRQIEAKALKKLRKPNRVNPLKEYLY